MSNNFYQQNRALLTKPNNIIFFSCMLFAAFAFNKIGVYPAAYALIVSMVYELGKILLTSKRPVIINYLSVGILIPGAAAIISILLKQIILAFF